tara:strand:- start:1190 stop:1363 length:174 start_codon:yes stop_codon:yes gene_type:complete
LAIGGVFFLVFIEVIQLIQYMTLRSQPTSSDEVLRRLRIHAELELVMRPTTTVLLGG